MSDGISDAKRATEELERCERGEHVPDWLFGRCPCGKVDTWRQPAVQPVKEKPDGDT